MNLHFSSFSFHSFNFFGAEHLKNITYHSGKAVYLDKTGFTMLLQKSKVSDPSTIQAILDNSVIKELGIESLMSNSSLNVLRSFYILI